MKRWKEIPRRIWKGLYGWWASLASEERRQVHALTFCVVGYISHYLVFTIAQPFYIEDAGITFSYARNFAEGHGFVTYLGGERVEGFSNPLWTFLIALFHIVRVPVWTSSKLMGAIFGAITVVLAWAITRRARAGKNDLANIIPSFLLAASTQFVLWNASGLENSLYNVLMAAAIYRLIREGTEGGRPWSAFLLFLLAITRPEGPLYGVIGGMVLLVLSFRQERLILRMLRWSAVFLVPFALYHIWRYLYFGWPWPNTYYAKLSQENRFKPFAWDLLGWKYLKTYLKNYWIAWVAPLFILSLLGTRRWRAIVGYALIAVLTGLLVWNGKWSLLERWDSWSSVEKAWPTLRTSAVYLSALACLVLVAGQIGWRARFTVGAFFCASVFWVIYSGGDWMEAHRLANFISVPLFLLLGLGISELWSLLPELRWRLPGRIRVQSLLVALSTLAIAVPNAWGSYNFTMDPETSVRDVRRRVAYMSWVQKKLHLEDVLLFDVDMGAHLWYSGWKIMDIAGLVDVSMGHHQKFPKSFLQEYVFEENKPDFFHIHGGWAKRTKLNTFAEFKQDYIEIPGYPAGATSLHVGNHIRRDHIASKRYSGPRERRVDFATGVVLEGWSLPSNTVPTGGKYYFETWFRAIKHKTGFRVLAFLYNEQGVVSVQELAPGYDWLPPKEWKVNDHVVGKYDIQLPDSLPEGEYRIGVVLLDNENGEILARVPSPELPRGYNEDPLSEDLDLSDLEALDSSEEDSEGEADSSASPVQAEAPADSGPVVYMRGEALLDQTLWVVSRERATEEATADLELAFVQASSGSCEQAWDSWRDARRHILRNTSWQESNEPKVRSAIAECWVGLADMAQEPDKKADLLLDAADFDYRNAALIERARPLARDFMSRGITAKKAEDWETAYDAFAIAVQLDPRLSFARRFAEECRDQRLGIGDDGREKPKSKKNKPERPPKKEPSGRGPLEEAGHVLDRLGPDREKQEDIGEEPGGERENRTPASEQVHPVPHEKLESLKPPPGHQNKPSPE